MPKPTTPQPDTNADIAAVLERIARQAHEGRKKWYRSDILFLLALVRALVSATVDTDDKDGEDQ